jgi:predicted transcriptional regulator
LTREFLSSLRSYQEAHTNYFEDLEQKSYSFSNRFMLIWRFKFLEELTAILIEEYGYTIEELVFSEQDQLRICDLFVPKSKTLLLSKDIDEHKKAFILAKEIAYNYLQITERLYTFS